MTPKELVEKAAQAIRSSKYRTTQNVHAERRALPPSIPDRRYAVAAVAAALHELADLSSRLGPIPSGALTKLAHEVEKEEPSR